MMTSSYNFINGTSCPPSLYLIPHIIRIKDLMSEDSIARRLNEIMRLLLVLIGCTRRNISHKHILRGKRSSNQYHERCVFVAPHSNAHERWCSRPNSSAASERKTKVLARIFFLFLFTLTFIRRSTVSCHLSMHHVRIFEWVSVEQLRPLSDTHRNYRLRLSQNRPRIIGCSALTREHLHHHHSTSSRRTGTHPHPHPQEQMMLSSVLCVADRHLSTRVAVLVE